MSFWISNPSMISSSGPLVCLFVCLFSARALLLDRMAAQPPL